MKCYINSFSFNPIDVDFEIAAEMTVLQDEVYDPELKFGFIGTVGFGSTAIFF